jgi:ketosteroid isomerase-like protein
MRCRGALSALLAVGLAVPVFAKPVDHHTRTEIDELVTAYADHFNQHDLAGVTALLTADAVIVSATAPSMGTSVNSGEQEVTAFLQAQFNEGTHLDKFSDSQVEGIRYNAVMIVGEWHAVGTSRGGHYDLIGHWTAVAVRLGHSWRIRLLTQFTDPPIGTA